MKIIFLAIMVCPLWLQTTNAQMLNHKSQQQVAHERALDYLLHQNDNGCSTARTTGVPSERVIAQSTRDNTLDSLSDSVSLKYASYRGAVYDYDLMEYAYNYPYSTSPMFNFNGIFTKPQVLCDTFRRWTTDPFTLVFGYYESAYATYDANKNLLTYHELFADTVNNRNAAFDNTFNAANNITGGNWYNFNAGVADTAFMQLFTYNGSNKITKDSIYEYHAGTWHLVSKTYYTYDVSGNLANIGCYANPTDTNFTAPLAEQVQYQNSYDAAGRLNTVQTNIFNGSSLSPYVKDTFAYTGTITFHTSWKEYQYDAINGYWTPLIYMTKHINAAGVPDTVNIQSWDSLSNAWIPQSMDIASYDGFHNPDSLQDYEYNFTSFPSSPTNTTHYYYEAYSDNTSVAQLQRGNDVKIFPNPASDRINIIVSGILPEALITTTILDAAGHRISRTSSAWHNGMWVRTDYLLPGNYWLVIQDAAGSVITRQTFVKL
jgi:hypothetical protein